MNTETEQAIRCFEELTRLGVVVHDLTHRLWAQLPLRRFRHGHPACRPYKEGPGESRCVRFESTEFRAAAIDWTQGRVHRCHAGLVELGLPVFESENLLLVLFAGPARLANAGLLDVDEANAPSLAGTAAFAQLPQIAKGKLQLYLELLRQLGARLRCIIRDRSWLPADRESLPRRVRIERFIEAHYREPIHVSDIARELHLSPGRCRHVIEETCGDNFRNLLRKARIRSACALLLNSDLSVTAVAESCGLADPSGFSRAFAAEAGCSPGRWRSMYRGKAVKSRRRFKR